MTFEISIHAPHAGSDLSIRYPAVDSLISIHAPHAGSDPQRRQPGSSRHYFNPRSQCGERRNESYTYSVNGTFQSTLPMRGATWSVPGRTGSRSDFNPRSPCGERRNRDDEIDSIYKISIHTPHAGSDLFSMTS